MKNLIFFLISFFFVSKSFAQTPTLHSSVPQMQIVADSSETNKNDNITNLNSQVFEGNNQTKTQLRSARIANTAYFTWTERGPYTDVVGPSNSNTRANNAVTAGRVRATWVDLSDATKKTVWVGSVSGGLWKTTDITAALPTWTLVNDFLSNLAVTGICQDPTHTNIIYFCTGEGFYNDDAVQGQGVFKSLDGGATWTNLSSTTTYTSCTKILCDAAGNIYLGTTGFYFLRSTNGGTSWTNINPTGLSSRTADFEISSTGRLHISCGLGNPVLGGYRFTDNPSTVTSATWTSATTPFTFPSGVNTRLELACLGNTLYAAPCNNNALITQIHKSTDGGVTWTTNALTATNIADLNGSASLGIAWYSIGLGIDPSNVNNVIVGSVNCLKSTDGGATWTKMSEWFGSTGQYIHAYIHSINWFDNGNKLLISSDGGVFYSSDKGTTIRDRNTNLRIKQFYSCAIHPSSANYFLGGTQANGTHQLNGSGISSSVEVTGGEIGGFVAIDQDQPQYQFGTYTYNQYRRSTNGGATWANVNFSSTNGQYINPWDYDNTNNKIYAATTAGSYLRWDDPQTGSTNVTQAIASFNSATVSAVKISPYTNHLIFFGTDAGRIVKVSAANTASPTATNLTAASMTVNAYVSCINVGTDDNNLIMCFSNYGINSIWVTSNGGTTWTTIDGNLPNIPVRWVMFYPNDNAKAIIATETGIWVTDLINGSSTVWDSNPSFPTVRTDMIKYRPSDGTLLAATHGRGLWTTNLSGNYTLKTGNWNDPTVWSLARVPLATDRVVINATHIITVSSSYTVKSLTIYGNINKSGSSTIFMAQ